MKAVGDFAGGINSYNAGKYTRSMMAVNSQNTLNAGLSERQAIESRADMITGQQQVAQGGSGFQTGTGTALDMLKMSAANRELDLMTSRMKANNQSQDFAQRGAIAYSQGKSAMAGGIINGFSDVAKEIAAAVTGDPGLASGGPDISESPVNMTDSFGGAGNMGGISSMDFGGAGSIGAGSFSDADLGTFN